MGEVADMMIDGTLCHGCGVYIEEGQAEGFPRYCSDCQEEKGDPLPCIACDHVAKYEVTPDLDVKGLPVCEDCSEQVEQDLQAALIKNTDEMWKWFEDKYNLNTGEDNGTG